MIASKYKGYIAELQNDPCKGGKTASPGPKKAAPVPVKKAPVV